MFQALELLTKLSVSGLAYAQEAGAPVGVVPPAPAPWMQFVPFAVIIGVFYFFLIRPQAKKQKETQKFLSALKVGDQIVTQSGILGRITNLTEQVATIEVANQVQIRVMRAQVVMSQEVLQAKKEVK